MALSGSGPRALHDGRGCYPQPSPPQSPVSSYQGPNPECSSSELFSHSLPQVGPTPAGEGVEGEWTGWAGDQEACRVGSRRGSSGWGSSLTPCLCLPIPSSSLTRRANEEIMDSKDRLMMNPNE